MNVFDKILEDHKEIRSMLDKAMTSPRALRRSNIAAGVALIVVGLIIPFT